MTTILSEQVVSRFGLTNEQKQAALARERDIIVTAGAGSGKTRTLVARYVSLLAEGLEPRRVVAITFTEKAAREMRSRVWDALSALIIDAQTEQERQKWLTLSTQMDSARISTIHSLCTEILHAHPAESGIDPRFAVLDEGLTSALRGQVVEDTLGSFVENPVFMPLFTLLETRELGNLLQFLIEHRLEASECFAEKLEGPTIVKNYLDSAMRRPELADAIADLHGMSHTDLQADKLYEMITELLSRWTSAENALEKRDLCGCAQTLYQARRENMKLNVGKKVCRTKDILRVLRDAFDDYLDPVVGGKEPRTGPDSESEARFAELSPLLAQAFEQLMQNYRAALDQRQALDFDDLEAGAERLLAREDVRLRWQGELDALLVDEFQDTNPRQLRIVESLAGNTGRLFVVGDARQSIYRFRRADVTVFRGMQQEVERAGGLPFNLDRTYRAHEPLLQVTGDLLSRIMGSEEDPERPYQIPFAPLIADRKQSPEHIRAPHVEFVFGAGGNAGEARPVMAKALAKRLLELKTDKEIRTWDEVALLFRASTGFAAYENAFEDMGIPFVTVAGRGFYDRPEIRDVLNILHALADPTDDLAMAGLLRSPAFGLTDSALYLLRVQGDELVPYWQALKGDFNQLDEMDQERARRTAGILNRLLPKVDRIPVAELLKQLVDLTDYRAIMATEGGNTSGGRLWRNLDKLLSDAHSSGQVNVRDFLDYLTTLSDAGAREGEAPADAQGAVRLMTIHKSKGLEFPLVVLADAGREKPGSSEGAYLLPEIGMAVQLDPPPMLYRLAKWQDGRQNEAESLRILYVALTRAENKLIISGHTTRTKKGEWTSSEWMGKLTFHAGVDLNGLLNQPAKPVLGQTSSGCPVRAIAYIATEDVEPIPLDKFDTLEDATTSLPLFQPIGSPPTLSESHDEPDEVHPWRATGYEAHIPPSVIGQMVHRAIELWLFPEDSRLIPFLAATALHVGLSNAAQKAAAISRTVELLKKLRAHPVWEEINSAQARYHEVPYSRMNGERAETGYIDLLYYTPTGWQVVDFKTDVIRNDATRAKLIEQYRFQLIRYEKAVNSLLGQTPAIYICFLDDHGYVNVVQANNPQDSTFVSSLTTTSYS
jgi:ATP-dependent helicase/nuclease subunit A